MDTNARELELIELKLELQRSRGHQSIKGSVERAGPDMICAAPILVGLNPGSLLVAWLAEMGWDACHPVHNSQASKASSHRPHVTGHRRADDSPRGSQRWGLGGGAHANPTTSFSSILELLA